MLANTSPEVGGIDQVERKAWRLGVRVAEDLQQADDVRRASQVAQDLDLSAEAVLLHGLHDLDGAGRAVTLVDGLFNAAMTPRDCGKGAR